MAPTTSISQVERPGRAGGATQPVGERSWPGDVPLTTAGALGLLEGGVISVVGRLVEASNATFYCELGSARSPDPSAATVHAVYKPIRGERPLADFPDGTLAYREVAAWLVSEASGLGIVPPTVLRDGPVGPGMVQLWIDEDPEADPLTLVLTRDPRLRSMALLDLMLNNADRKAGHLLPTPDGAILGCDHGICFAAEPKLRTVLWGWVGEAFDEREEAALRAVAAGLAGQLGTRLGSMLSDDEVEATGRRVEALSRLGHFPAPDRDRRVIPWPPF